VKFLTFLVFFFLKKKLRGEAGQVPGNFQGAPPQPALHRAGGPNKGLWPALWVRFLGYMGRGLQGSVGTGFAHS
jgi:hypothetical protein